MSGTCERCSTPAVLGVPYQARPADRYRWRPRQSLDRRAADARSQNTAIAPVVYISTSLRKAQSRDRRPSPASSNVGRPCSGVCPDTRPERLVRTGHVHGKNLMRLFSESARSVTTQFGRTPCARPQRHGARGRRFLFRAGHCIVPTCSAVMSTLHRDHQDALVTACLGAGEMFKCARAQRRSRVVGSTSDFWVSSRARWTARSRPAGHATTFRAVPDRHGDEHRAACTSVPPRPRSRSRSSSPSRARRSLGPKTATS
jgi:hypothetical protein